VPLGRFNHEELYLPRFDEVIFRTLEGIADGVVDGEQLRLEIEGEALPGGERAIGFPAPGPEKEAPVTPNEMRWVTLDPTDTFPAGSSVGLDGTETGLGKFGLQIIDGKPVRIQLCTDEEARALDLARAAEASEDPRVLPLETLPGSDRRGRTFYSAAAASRTEPQGPGYPIDGPQVTAECLDFLAASHMRPTERAHFFRTNISKVGTDDGAHENYLSWAEAIEHALTWDQLDGKNNACVEAMFRQLVLEEMKVKRRLEMNYAKEAGKEGAGSGLRAISKFEKEVILGTRASRGTFMIPAAFAKYSAGEVTTEADSQKASLKLNNALRGKT
jgi:hypothetical protein